MLRESRSVLDAFGVARLSLFGSFARDEGGEDSDVDLLVEFNRPIGLFEFVRLQRQLGELVGHRVDLVTPAALAPVPRPNPKRGRCCRLEIGDFAWKDILGAIANIENYVAGLDFDQFRADQKTVDAVVRNLEVIGEATRHLSTNQEAPPVDIPWTDIAGMRTILVHEYFGVDLTIIWQTITQDLPALRIQLERLPEESKD